MLSRKTVFATLAAALAAGCTTFVVEERDRARIAAKVSGGAAPAAEAGTRRFPFTRDTGLEQAVRFALANRPSMASARLAVLDARLAVKQAAADAPLASSMPWNSVHVDAGAGYSESSRAAHHGDFKAKTQKGDASALLSLDLLVYDFGRWDARMNELAENVVAAEQALDREGCTVFGEVSDAWFALSRDIALSAVADSNVVQYASRLAQAQDRFDAGEAQLLDVLRAKLDLSTAKEAAVAASNDVAVSEAKLAYATGLDPAAGAPGAFPLREIRALAPGLDETAAAFAKTSASADELVEFSATNAPAMKAARARLRASSAQVDYAVADLRPSFSASVSLNWTDPLWYWRWGVNAAQSIFTGGRKTAAVERAVAAMLSAEADFDAQLQTLRRDLELAVAERDNAAEALATARDAFRQAEENLQTVKAQLETGEASRVDFADAMAGRTSAAAGIVRAACRGQSAEAAIYALSGGRPVFIEPEKSK